MTKAAEKDIQEILFSEEVLRTRVQALALEVSRDYQGKDLHLVAVLKGAMVFLADFSRALSVQTTMDFLVVSSYEGATHSGEMRIVKDLTHPIRERHVLLVEDIVDHGTTLSSLVEALRLRGPASLKVCTLFYKTGQRKSGFRPDYNGFEIPDVFVVGYGLDYREKYRELPFLGTVRKEVLERF